MHSTYGTCASSGPEHASIYPQNMSRLARRCARVISSSYFNRQLCLSKTQSHFVDNEVLRHKDHFMTTEGKAALNLNLLLRRQFLRARQMYDCFIKSHKVSW